MAALTENRDTPIKVKATQAYPMAAATKIFAGAAVVVTKSTGNCTNATDATGVAFVGIAIDLYDNTGGAAAAKQCVVRNTGVVEFAATGTLTVGDTAYVADNQTVTDATTATNDVAVGKVVKISGGRAWVDIG